MKNYLIAICALFLISFTVQQVIEQGKASYYSSKFEGRRTSSGDIFRQDSLTAAHKSSPHVIDLSLKAAKKLNFVRQGITTVTIEKIEQL